MPKFTPGPWKIGKRSNMIVGNQDQHVADCVFTHSNSLYKTNPDPQECEANARLIAAAPDILTALQACVETLKTYRKSGNMLDAILEAHNSHPTDYIIQQSEAAIRKAQGE